MFITKQQLLTLKQYEDTPELAMALGEDIEYYTLLAPGHLCGMYAKIAGMRLDPIHGKDGPFYIDLAIGTPVEDVYIYLKDLLVVSIVLERKDGTTVTAVAKSDQVDKIREFYDAGEQ